MLHSGSLSYNNYSDPAFVAKYAASIVDNAWNAYYERPGTLSLLPEDIAGKKILDAGCGPGLVAALFGEKGAQVTAIDYSNEMVQRTREITHDKIPVLRVDLNNGLEAFEDNTFDIIYSSLVIHYIDDLNSLFKEFSRVLHPGGLLVFSTDHPDNPDFKDKVYTGKEVSSVFWQSYNLHMEVYERPWSEITGALANNHFQVEEVLTPQPTLACKEKYPKDFEYLSNNPHFICVRAANAKP